MVLTAGRRCRRRRPGVGGGAASVYTAALVPLLRSGSSSTTNGASPLVRLHTNSSLRSGDAPAAASVGPPPRLLSPTSPFFSPLRWRLWEGAKNPNAGWWRGQLLLALLSCF
jgi:hypothetical protein